MRGWWNTRLINLPYGKAHAFRGMLHFYRKTGLVDIREIHMEKRSMLPMSRYRITVAFVTRRNIDPSGEL